MKATKRIRFNAAVAERLAELLRDEHGGCDDNTCDVTAALEAGYALWASYLFDGSGAASKEFSETYAKAGISQQRLERERRDFVDSVPHVQCWKCNAYAWDVDGSDDWHCDSCAAFHKGILCAWEYRSKARYRAELYYIGTEHVGYRFWSDGTVIFEGTDYRPSPMHAQDSLEALASLLSFLALKDGDTDDEYFAKYTPAQLAWRDAFAEDLSNLVCDLEEPNSEGHAEVAAGFFRPGDK